MTLNFTIKVEENKVIAIDANNVVFKKIDINDIKKKTIIKKTDDDEYYFEYNKQKFEINIINNTAVLTVPVGENYLVTAHFKKSPTRFSAVIENNYIIPAIYAAYYVEKKIK